MKEIRDVRLIDSEGHNLGIMNVRDALKQAKEADLDLLLASKEANPPVCKILDFGKFKYDERKKEKEHKHHTQEIKEVKISPRTAEHDLNISLKKINHFLEQGDKVKITCAFKTREIQFPEIGRQKIQYLLDRVTHTIYIEKEPENEKNMHTILAPKC